MKVLVIQIALPKGNELDALGKKIQLNSALNIEMYM